jgi:hypothetical protein
MNKTAKILGIAIYAGILAFAIFQLANYMYVDTLFNSATGGHISDVSQQDINDLKQLQAKSQALLDDFNSRS